MAFRNVFSRQQRNQQKERQVPDAMRKLIAQHNALIDAVAKNAPDCGEKGCAIMRYREAGFWLTESFLRQRFEQDAKKQEDRESALKVEQGGIPGGTPTPEHQEKGPSPS